jgi:hypothetical protein
MGSFAAAVLIVDGQLMALCNRQIKKPYVRFWSRLCKNTFAGRATALRMSMGSPSGRLRGPKLLKFVVLYF